MGKSRVLFIIHMPPPVHGASMMGQYIKDSSLINTTFDCHFINATIASTIEDVGQFRFKKIFGILSKNYEIIKAVRKINPQIVYFTPTVYGKPFYKDCITMFLLKFFHCQIVVQNHNKGVSLRQSNKIDDFLYRHFFKGIKVILLSNLLYDDISKYVAKENVYVCPNGIPEEKETFFQKKTSGKFQILFLSNMIVEKGVWTLLDACKVLVEKEVEFECHFVGGWGDITEEEFKKAILTANLEKQVFPHGPMYGKEKEKMISQTDLFVFPTYYSKECFPLVLLEAMKYGKACISTTEGAIPEIITEGDTGYLIKPKDVEALANCIENLMSNRDLCSHMGSNGKVKFNKFFTKESYEKRICEIIKNIAKTSC